MPIPPLFAALSQRHVNNSNNLDLGEVGLRKGQDEASAVGQRAMLSQAPVQVGGETEIPILALLPPRGISELRQFDVDD